MVTYNTIVYDIKETLTSNKIVDDYNLDDRRIIYIFNNIRNLLLKREYNLPGKRFDTSIIQSMCVDLELKNSDICPCSDYDGCDEFLVSTVAIPPFLELHHKPAIVKIGSPDLKNYFFSVVPYAQSIYSGKGRFNNNGLYAFLIENKIYIPIKNAKHKLIERINIMGVFEDPTELSKFNNCTTNTVCFDKDAPYPINGANVSLIKELVLKEIGMQFPKDNINDANYSIQEPVNNK